MERGGKPQKAKVAKKKQEDYIYWAPGKAVVVSKKMVLLTLLILPFGRESEEKPKAQSVEKAKIDR